MPRIRYLKPEFFSDEDICSLPYQSRIAFAGLWCYADKAGRLEDRPKFLKVSIFPYDNIDMEKILQSLTDTKPFINRYEHAGKRYIQITNWDKHQKPHHTERESIFPPAPPLKTKIMGMGTENQLNPSTELSNGDLTVKKPLNSKPFELFWENYPKKKNKGDAEKAWMKIKPSNELQQKITQTVEKLKKTEDWIKEAGRFIPYPASWLNAKGWEDQVKTKEESWKDELRSMK